MKNTWLPTKYPSRDTLQGLRASKASCSRHSLVASCGKQHGTGLRTQAQGGQELPGVHLQKQDSPSHRVEHAHKAMEEGNWRDTGDKGPARGLPDVTDTCHPCSFFPLPGPSLSLRTTLRGCLCLGFLHPLRAPELGAHIWCPSCATHLERNFLKLPGTAPCP